MIAFYGRTLKVVLRYQTVTLLIAVATLMLTVYLYIIIPKGFFPVQDTGVIQGITQATQTIGSKSMTEKQKEVAKDHPARPGSREPVFVYRRGWHEHHAEQRKNIDQS